MTVMVEQAYMSTVKTPGTGPAHSFAVCAYGESPYLEACLRSLKAQTVKEGTEILICTSTPNSHISRLAEKYGVPLRVRDVEKEGGKRKYYEGLPVTAAAIIFPSVMMFQYVLPMDITLIYFPVILITGILFISRFRIPKPGMRGILIMVGIGILEFIFMIIAKSLLTH